MYSVEKAVPPPPPPPPALLSSSGPPWPGGALLHHLPGHVPAATGLWWGYAAPSIVPTTEGREVLIPKQLPPQRGQRAVKTASADQIQVQMIRFQQTALIRPLAPN